MSLFWPILWIASILVAVIAFMVTALRENSRKRSASLSMQSKMMPVSDAESMPGESIENFPTESFDFDDGSQK